MLRALFDEAEGQRVPQDGCAAVAKNHIPVFGQVEQRAHALLQAEHDVLDRVLAVAGAQVVAAGRGKRSNGFVANQAGPRTKPAIGRQKVGRDGDFGH